MAEIDIGGDVINDSQNWSSNYTIVSKTNPANEAGIIDTVNIWANLNMSGCIIAIFSVDGNNVTARDSVYIGDISFGSQQLTDLSLEVEAGDYIGMYFSGGKIERNDNGGSGMWFKTGDQTSCVDTAFTFNVGDRVSLNGTGETAAAEKDNSIFFGCNF